MPWSEAALELCVVTVVRVDISVPFVPGDGVCESILGSLSHLGTHCTKDYINVPFVPEDFDRPSALTHSAYQRASCWYATTSARGTD
jgi:hypothetical protein